jgi:hypothetical protein
VGACLRLGWSFFLVYVGRWVWNAAELQLGIPG